ncbi:receptor-like protein EIX1 [Cryptomeria japonica]|uniref:receptor-like protein EIX1 n=1 Tax=Cryptomeria japonica TaxID=3369 RepID=UPI0025AD6DB6|nr:receptor-like protein EIX1 [Cryptomeria japonica]
MLVGSIPSEIGNSTKLRFFNISTNRIGGHILSTITRLSRLEMLDVSNNQLMGILPHDLANCTTLNLLNVGYNHLSGAIPPNLGTLENLNYLMLPENRFTGNIGAAVHNLSGLLVLDFWANLFTGKFPDRVLDFLNLTILILRQNKLWGTIPVGISRLSKLEILDLSSNRFHGEIPSQLGNILGMQYSSGIYLPPNRRSYFFYNIDVYLAYKGKFRQLKRLGYKLLDFSDNRFTGEIPSSIGSLHGLFSLSGEIPSTLGSISTLAKFNVSCNKLSGRIPVGPQFLTFDADAFSNNSGLCGAPLPKPCFNVSSSPSPLPVSNRKHNEDINWEFFAGMGIGYLMGVGLLLMGMFMSKRLRNLMLGSPVKRVSTYGVYRYPQ